MTYQWDAFSKSLAEESVPRRQSLRLLGAAIAGAVFSPLGTAWAAGPDPCKAFCNQCSNKTQRNQCLAACRACNGNTGRLAGSCGSYACCSTASCGGVCSDLRSDPNCGACGIDCGDIGETCCGSYCADLANDMENCGRCGVRCDLTGPYEYGACVEGACVYECVDGALDCGDGMCTYLGDDPDNCGACGNICGAGTTCRNGTCQPNNCVPNCPTNWCGGDGCGGTCGCPADYICVGDGLNMCVPNDGTVQCFGGQALCGGVCREIQLDPSNCGGCGVQCGPGENCAGGVCQSAE